MKNATTELKGSNGETLEVTTVKFDPVAAYLMVGQLEHLKPNRQGATKALTQSALLEVLAGTSIVRSDADGKAERIELNSIAKINRACGDFKTLMLVVNHAVEVNYANFFDESDESGSPILTPSP